mmetsp:Transcript_208/g.534  ORF Transcript_208/g.534 Transcript_208/m.534 type:complete len:219 (+) Transcript_208:715-1371(+)
MRWYDVSGDHLPAGPVEHTDGGVQISQGIQGGDVVEARGPDQLDQGPIADCLGHLPLLGNILLHLREPQAHHAETKTAHSSAPAIRQRHILVCSRPHDAPEAAPLVESALRRHGRVGLTDGHLSNRHSAEKAAGGHIPQPHQGVASGRASPCQAPFLPAAARAPAARHAGLDRPCDCSGCLVGGERHLADAGHPWLLQRGDAELDQGAAVGGAELHAA